ncbi:MAG: hypothetical protein ACXV8I_10620 [Methylobacter sp.]
MAILSFGAIRDKAAIAPYGSVVIQNITESLCSAEHVNVGHKQLARPM